LDPSLTSGGIIATIGISTVFFALVTLIGLVSLMAWMLAPEDAPASETALPPHLPEPAPSAETEPAPAPAEPDYQQIALTAYAYHRRATTRVRSGEPSSSWEVAGRIRELNQRTDRN
jgi:hypothetical protein